MSWSGWGEIAHQMALLPLVWLVARALRGKATDAAYWWTCAAFVVSWLADSIADVLPLEQRWVVSIAFPVSQAALIGAVWLPSRRVAVEFTIALAVIGIFAVLWQGVDRPDIILSSFANVGVAWIAWRYYELPDRLRVTLLVYFGLGGIAWFLHALDIALHSDLSVRSWYPYQACRLAGLLLFCWAVSNPSPKLRLT